MAADHPSPLFIVGSPRSGTSILALALRSVGYRGFNEGNFLGLYPTFIASRTTTSKVFGTDNPRVMMSRFDREEIKAGISDLLKRFTERENPVSPWVNKSGNPEVINSIPTLINLSGRRVISSSQNVVASRMSFRACGNSLVALSSIIARTGRPTCRRGVQSDAICPT